MNLNVYWCDKAFFDRFMCDAHIHLQQVGSLHVFDSKDFWDKQSLKGK